jgi:moderate conductance mechanosensitive channel
MIQVDSLALVQLTQLRSEWTERFNWAVVTATGLRILGALLVSWLAYYALKVLLRRVEKSVGATPGVVTPHEQRTRTLLSLLRSVGLVLIAVMTVFMVLGAVGVQLAPLLAGAGVVGLAVSFGAQSLVKDVISGLFTLFENQFGVGDVIRIEGVSGTVEKMTLRVVVLRDVHGVVHIVPNGQITKVSNLTRSWARAVLDVEVAYREDPDRVIAVLRELGRELYEDAQWRPLLIDPVEVPGIETMTDSSITIRVMVKTLPLKQWEVARELRRRIKLRFDQEDIHVPTPLPTVVWDGATAPAAVHHPAAGAADPDGPHAR